MGCRCGKRCESGSGDTILANGVERSRSFGRTGGAQSPAEISGASFRKETVETGQNVAQLRNKRAARSVREHVAQGRLGLGRGARLAGACILLFLFLLTGLMSVQARGLASPASSKSTEGGNGTPVELTPGQSPTVVETAPAAPWDETVLSELADRLGWPSVVVVDGTGKYVIELDISSNEWAQASIRPFAYQTSAETAFSAEQEDAAILGIQRRTDHVFRHIPPTQLLRTDPMVTWWSAGLGGWWTPGSWGSPVRNQQYNFVAGHRRAGARTSVGGSSEWNAGATGRGAG